MLDERTYSKLSYTFTSILPRPPARDSPVSPLLPEPLSRHDGRDFLECLDFLGLLHDAEHGDHPRDVLSEHEGPHVDGDEYAHDDLTVHSVREPAVARDGVPEVLDVEGPLEAGREEAAEGRDERREERNRHGVQLRRRHLRGRHVRGRHGGGGWGWGEWGRIGRSIPSGHLSVTYVDGPIECPNGEFVSQDDLGELEEIVEDGHEVDHVPDRHCRDPVEIRCRAEQRAPDCTRGRGAAGGGKR